MGREGSADSAATGSVPRKPTGEPGPSSRLSHGLRLLERVSVLIQESDDLQETLDSVVRVIAQRLRTEACSLYLLNEGGDSLTLWATDGLEGSAVGHVHMNATPVARP